MGDRVCYMAFCPACEKAVAAMEGTCPDCGEYVEYS